MITSDDIHGVFNHRPFYDLMLERLPRGGSVVEVGVFYGKSIIYLAQHASAKGLRIYGVDSFCFGQMPYQDADVFTDIDFYERCVQNLFKTGVERQVTLIALPSSGLHSNGFSLVRKVLNSKELKKYSKELLRPTKLYAKGILALKKKVNINE